MADSPYIFEIDQSNYEQIVLRGSHQVPILVDFWATWCQPCQILMPVLAKLANEYQGRFVLAKINTEEQQAIAAQFGIRSIPAVKLFKNGAPVDEFTGALPEAQIRAFLDKHLPRASDGAVAQAEQHLLAGDVESALRLLHDARTADPANPRITIAIAQTEAAAGKLDAAQRVLDELPAEEQDKPEVRQLRGQLFFDAVAMTAQPPDVLSARLAENARDSEARYQLAAHLMMANDVENALENLLAVMQRDRKYGDDAARLAILRIFDMFGDDPGITRYRARLFTLLH